MKKSTLAIGLVVGLVALFAWTFRLQAQSTYFASYCASCHVGVAATCNGCHSHGTHSGSTKSDLNVAGATDKTSYAPGETVSVTITGGYRSGWIRAILYDQNMKELARSTGANTMGGGSGYPITLTAPAPATAGTYTWNVAWYGNQYDASGAFFGPKWTPDPTNGNHGQEIVSVKPFTVVAAAAPSIALSPAALDFGTVTVGSNVSLTVQVQNKGTATLNVTAIGLCTGTSTEFTWTPTTAFTVAPAGSQVLSVDFKPVDTTSHTGCLQIASNDPTTPTVSLTLTAAASTATTPSPTPTPTDGATLYTQYCAGCHGPLATSTKLGATATQIQTGISTVSAMSSLSTLTTTQIQAIAAALAPTTTPTPTPTPTPTTDGATLYSQYCSGCHGSLSSSSVKGASASQIQSALTSVSQMRSISLTSTQIQAIAAALSGTTTPTPTPTPTPTTDGATLYTQNCAGCHGSLSTTSLRGVTASQISSAISSVSQMRTITLTATQIQAISTALSTAPAPTPTPTPTPTGGPDFDIAGFSATQSVTVGNSVSFRLRVANPGTMSGYANATLVGMRDSTQVYMQTIQVTAPTGGTQSFTFPAYKTTSVGVITWTVTIADPTPDKATATTTVYRSSTTQERD